MFDRIIAKTKSAEGHYSEKDAAGIMRKILDAIDYCHTVHNICHRCVRVCMRVCVRGGGTRTVAYSLSLRRFPLFLFFSSHPFHPPQLHAHPRPQP
jgi:serine/threonine protein kinase